jgi:hypothetical protein
MRIYTISTYIRTLYKLNKYLLLSISSDGWQIHCSPTYIIDFLDLELCSVICTLGAITYINKYIQQYPSQGYMGFYGVSLL